MLKLAVIAAILFSTIECKYLLAETDSDEDSSQLQKDQVSLSSQLIMWSVEQELNNSN